MLFFLKFIPLRNIQAIYTTLSEIQLSVYAIMIIIIIIIDKFYIALFSN